MRRCSAAVLIVALAYAGPLALAGTNKYLGGWVNINLDSQSKTNIANKIHNWGDVGYLDFTTNGLPRYRLIANTNKVGWGKTAR